jgi:hypothetical protein
MHKHINCVHRTYFHYRHILYSNYSIRSCIHRSYLVLTKPHNFLIAELDHIELFDKSLVSLNQFVCYQMDTVFLGKKLHDSKLNGKLCYPCEYHDTYLWENEKFQRNTKYILFVKLSWATKFIHV